MGGEISRNDRCRAAAGASSSAAARTCSTSLWRWQSRMTRSVLGSRPGRTSITVRRCRPVSRSSLVAMKASLWATRICSWLGLGCSATESFRMGGTIAERYAGRADISGEERDIARRISVARITLLSVRGAAPGRSVSVHDIGRDELVTVFSHAVSKSVKPGDVLVARIMAGPPAPSLWGPVAFIDRHSGRELRELLTTRIRSLGLPDEPGSLAMALQAASREITALVVRAQRRSGPCRRHGPASARLAALHNERPRNVAAGPGSTRPGPPRSGADRRSGRAHRNAR